MKLVPTDNSNFLRDLSTGALINRNMGELEVLKAQRAKLTKQDNEIEMLKMQIEELKKIVSARSDS